MLADQVVLPRLLSSHPFYSQGGRFERDRDYRGGGFRDRGPPGLDGYGPPDDFRGGGHGRGTQDIVSFVQ